MAQYTGADPILQSSGHTGKRRTELTGHLRTGGQGEKADREPRFRSSEPWGGGDLFLTATSEVFNFHIPRGDSETYPVGPQAPGIRRLFHLGGLLRARNRRDYIHEPWQAGASCKIGGNPDAPRT